MIHVALLPDEIESLQNTQVVILDVLRATSTIVTALSAGAREIRLFDSLDSARAARQACQGQGPVVLAGESRCIKPLDFDLGNSPREQVTEKVGGSTILLATTNGTRAAVVARNAGAKTLYAAALLNSTATAQALIPCLESGDTLLLCAGTNGRCAFEDTLGAGAILFALLQATYRTDLAFTDTAWLAYHAFTAVKGRLPAALRLGQGGINVIEAGLEDDIDHCARLDAISIVAAIEAEGAILRVRKS